VIGVRLVRVAAPLVAAVLLSSCIFGPDATRPSPSPSSSPTASVATRPRLELSTFQYSLQTKGRIRVAVRASGPPMMDLRSGNRYEGFEAALARELAKAIWGATDDPNTHIEWISADSSTRVSALTSNQADIAIAALAITDENKKVIDLSDTYLRTGQRLLIKKANTQIKEVVDVTSGDQTVCAVRGSAAEQNLKKATSDRAKVLSLDTVEFCMQALTSGAADAFTADELVLMGLAFNEPSLKLVGKPFSDERLGIGMKKNVGADRQGFLEFVNTALLKIVADRTWGRLYEKEVSPLSGETKQLPTD
jgi:ABC-type amino acid transport substrate-binding protein